MVRQINIANLCGTVLRPEIANVGCFFCTLKNCAKTPSCYIPQHGLPKIRNCFSKSVKHGYLSKKDSIKGFDERR